MEDRKPFQLRKVLIVYNFLQVLFSSWLFYEACVTGWLNGYSYSCQPVDYSRSPIALRVSAEADGGYGLGWAGLGTGQIAVCGGKFQRKLSFSVSKWRFSEDRRR